MDPTTPATSTSAGGVSPASPITTTSGAIHPSTLQPSLGADGVPILTGPGVTPTSPGAPFSASSTSTSSSSAGGYGGSANLSAPKSSSPAADPIAGLSGPDKSSTSTGSSSSSKGKTDTPAATGIRQRLNSLSHTVEGAADHPSVKNAKEVADRQLEGVREQLGRFPAVVEAEKKIGVDRVALVAGGLFLYIILIPLNLLGLALPTTQLLTFLPPSLLAVRTLDRPNEERTKTLLSYFVVFGFVQFAESLMAGFLERRIPQYYTVKLAFLAYLIHPRTKGARKIHQSILRPLLAKSQGQSVTSGVGSTAGTQTPPSTSTRSSDASSPTGRGFTTTGASAPAPVPTVGSATEVNAPLSAAGGFTNTTGSNKSEGFSRLE